MNTGQTITFFQVNNGNFCFIKNQDFTMIIDVNSRDVWDYIQDELRVQDGKKHLDVLCISHGDEDHCLGFVKLKEMMDAGKLVIGSIWHQNIDRSETEKSSDLSEEYKALNEEIERRQKASNSFGNIEVPVTREINQSELFSGLDWPVNLQAYIHSPGIEDFKENRDINDLSIVLTIQFEGLKILLTGDSGAEIWQDSIKPNYSADEVDFLVASHHGSASFFGNDREAVRDATEEPANYNILEAINPKHLIISANSRFPLNGDTSGDQPPHYAAYKWYKKWWVDKRNVSEATDHPDQFYYTADGHIRLEYRDGEWKMIDDWSPDDPDDSDENASSSKSNKEFKFKYHGGETKRERREYA